MPSFEGNLLIQRHKICPQVTRASMLSYGKNPDSLISPGLESVPGRDRRTDGETDGQNYDSQYALTTTSVACKTVFHELSPLQP